MDRFDECREASKTHGFESSAEFIITLLELEEPYSRAAILKKFRERVSRGKGRRGRTVVKDDIRQRAMNGPSRKDLAVAYGASYQIISKIINSC